MSPAKSAVNLELALYLGHSVEGEPRVRTKTGLLSMLQKGRQRLEEGIRKRDVSSDSKLFLLACPKLNCLEGLLQEALVKPIKAVIKPLQQVGITEV